MRNGREDLIRRIVIFFLIMICIAPVDTTFAKTTKASTKLTISDKSITMNEGEHYYLTSSKQKETKWTSSNKKVATVSSSGKVTGKKAGTAKITAQYKDLKATCTVTVIESDYTKSMKKVPKIIPKIIEEDMTDFQKVKAVHDYLIKNVRYDEDAFSVWSAILEGRAVCEGYAAAFELFMEELGIKTMKITGVTKGWLHEWNLVNLDGEWYHVDVTWDDPGTEDSGDHLYYYYFLISDKQMKSQNQDPKRTWDTEYYPKCTSEKYKQLGTGYGGADYQEVYGFSSYYFTEEMAKEDNYEGLTEKVIKVKFPSIFGITHDEFMLAYGRRYIDFVRTKKIRYVDYILSLRKANATDLEKKVYKFICGFELE